jgi:hypothetical protein
MEGTVTISIKDFDELRANARTLEYIKGILNEALNEANGCNIESHKAVRLLDYIISKTFNI